MLETNESRNRLLRSELIKIFEMEDRARQASLGTGEHHFTINDLADDLHYLLDIFFVAYSISPIILQRAACEADTARAIRRAKDMITDEICELTQLGEDTNVPDQV